MVQVIKQGKKNIAECLDCGSTLKYDPGEVWKEHEPPSGYDFEGYDHYYMRCPCGSRIEVTSKISGGVARRVEEIEKARERIDYEL
jgi:hypothetical protein